jgi:hypothetical protein
MRCTAVVVAEQDGSLIGEADQRWQCAWQISAENAIVLEQNHRLLGYATGKRTMSGTVRVAYLIDVHVRNGRCRIEHAEADAGRE